MNAPEDWAAVLDQALAGFRDMAKMTRGYFLELREQGFSEDQAMELVIAWQRGIQAQAQGGSES